MWITNYTKNLHCSKPFKWLMYQILLFFDFYTLENTFFWNPVSLGLIHTFDGRNIHTHNQNTYFHTKLLCFTLHTLNIKYNFMLLRYGPNTLFRSVTKEKYLNKFTPFNSLAICALFCYCTIYRITQKTENFVFI